MTTLWTLFFLLVAVLSIGLVVAHVWLNHAVATAKSRVLPLGFEGSMATSALPAASAAGEVHGIVERVAYLPKRVPEDVDYYIIGSGMGSLYCAALLAKSGKKCVVLEQHYVAGGCTHSFHDGGFEFDTGLHYVGRIEKYEELVDFVSTGSKVAWTKMGRESDGFAYDEIKLGDDPPFAFPAGEAAFIDKLAAEFPTEREAIVKYVALCKRVNKLSDGYFFAKLFHPLIQKALNCCVNREYFKYSSAKTWDIVCGITNVPRLRSLLCGQWGDYGLKPEDSSFLIHAGIVAHYIDGAYYPVGGSQVLSQAIIPTITANGGAVFVKARVSEIVCENGIAVGVRVHRVSASGEVTKDAEGTVLRSKHGVISGAGAMLTNDLVPTPATNKINNKRTNNDCWSPTISYPLRRCVLRLGMMQCFKKSRRRRATSTASLG